MKITSATGHEPKKKRMLNISFQLARTIIYYAVPLILISLGALASFFVSRSNSINSVSSPVHNHQNHHRLGIRSLHEDEHLISEMTIKTIKETTDVSSNKQCSPQNNIFFLKTHKAGSTTVQNILLRYGERNNLTFALPKQPAAHVFNYNIKFNPTMVRPSPTDDYNILCNHLHFAENGVREIMPADTKFVAIVRNPVDLFESIMSYYAKDVRAFQRIPGNSTRTKMKTFLDNPRKYYGYNMSHYERFARNAMMYDFGFDNSEEDESVIQGWIDYLDRTFDLVLITDYFDESMVLMKDELCWNMGDIEYLKSNSRSKNVESISEWLGQEYVDKLKEWNKADWMLYKHFNATFTKKLDAFGRDRMAQEVSKLQNANRRLERNCLSGDSSVRTVFKTVEITKYKLKEESDEFCQDLIRTERQYLYQINKRQEDLLQQNSHQM